MRRKMKTLTMVVTVRCPGWLDPKAARREVKDLINHQAFYGHRRSSIDPLVVDDEVGEHNFKAKAVRPVPKDVKL